jgi:serine/threonine protein kinase
VIDSLEILAQSRTFVVLNGKVQQLDDRAANPSEDGLLSQGSIIDSKYKILALIGQGGMGAIYKVHHVLLLKDMALKTFRSHRLSSDSWQRFQREAQAIAKLKHKNIVDVFDFGMTEKGLPYYTMELIPGKSVAEVLAISGRLAPSTALTIFRQVAEALAHAHRQSIVHRDIKPANIILTGDNPESADRGGRLQTKLVDFGIAKLAESTQISDDQSLTTAGTIFGSPLYMSPEQSLGLPTDLRTDMYSFGCALFESLTGKPPFVGDSAFITMLHHQRQSPPALKDSGVDFAFPQRLEALIAKLLAKTPAERYQTFEQIVEEIDWCNKAVPPERPTSKTKAGSKTGTKLAAASDGQATGENQAKAPGISKQLKLLASIAAVCAVCAVSYRTIKGALKQPADKSMTEEVSQDDKIPIGQAPSANGKVSTASKGDQPYYKGIKKTPPGEEKSFYFPQEDDLGNLSIEGRLKLQACRGLISIPANARIILIADIGLCQHPELFRKFGKDDLYGIELPAANIWSDKNFREISRLSGLQMLKLAEIDAFNRESLQLIDRLKNLKTLDVSGTGITAKDLISLQILPQIEELDVSDLHEFPVLLQHLVDVHARTHILKANSCALSNIDLPIVAKLPELTYFSCTNNKVTNDGMRDLLSAPKLQRLNIRNNGITWQGTSLLVKFKDLRKLNLKLDASHFSPEQLAKLRDSMSWCKISDVESQEFDYDLPQFLDK